MTNQIKIAGDLHDAAGLELPDREFREFWMTPVDGVVSIDLATALPAYKAKIKAQIEADAEEKRLNFITPGDGKSMAYRQKMEESLEVLGAVQSSDEATVNDLVNQPTASLKPNGVPYANLAEELYPVLMSRFGKDGSTVVECAQTVKSKFDVFRGVENIIDTTASDASEQIDNATTLDEVTAIYEAIQWAI